MEVEQGRQQGRGPILDAASRPIYAPVYEPSSAPASTQEWTVSGRQAIEKLEPLARATRWMHAEGFSRPIFGLLFGPHAAYVCSDRRLIARMAVSDPAGATQDAPWYDYVSRSFLPAPEVGLSHEVLDELIAATWFNYQVTFPPAQLREWMEQVCPFPDERRQHIVGIRPTDDLLNLTGNDSIEAFTDRDDSGPFLNLPTLSKLVRIDSSYSPIPASMIRLGAPYRLRPSREDENYFYVQVIEPVQEGVTVGLTTHQRLYARAPQMQWQLADFENHITFAHVYNPEGYRDFPRLGLPADLFYASLRLFSAFDHVHVRVCQDLERHSCMCNEALGPSLLVMMMPARTRAVR